MFVLSEKDIELISISGIKLEQINEIELACVIYKIGIGYGDTVCMNRYADILIDSKDDIDQLTAVNLYNKSCDLGSSVGCSNLALYYKLKNDLIRYDIYMDKAKSFGDPWENQ